MSEFGDPKDVDGECNAHLYIADNFGDNRATMRCSLPLGHDGPHTEQFERDEIPVIITWYIDEREMDKIIDEFHRNICDPCIEKIGYNDLPCDECKGFNDHIQKLEEYQKSCKDKYLKNKGI